VVDEFRDVTIVIDGVTSVGILSVVQDVANPNQYYIVGKSLVAIAATTTDDIEEFRASLSQWTFGKNKLTWDQYYVNLQTKFPADYERMITDYVAASSLTKSEAYSIFSTTTIFHQVELNRLIRVGQLNSSKVQDVIQLLDRALAKMPTVPSGVKYYRGLNLSDDALTAFINKHKQGQPVTYEEYTYTANNRADAFIDAESKNVKITITTKTGSNGKTIHPISFGKARLGTSDEAIFMRNTTFEVLKVEDKGSKVFEIELIEK
jgi:hypothetical protein